MAGTSPGDTVALLVVPPVNSRTRLPRPLVEDLIRAGALDGFGIVRRQQLWVLGGLQYQAEVLVEAPDVTADLPDLSEGEAMT